MIFFFYEVFKNNNNNEWYKVYLKIILLILFNLEFKVAQEYKCYLHHIKQIKIKDMFCLGQQLQLYSK